MQLGTSAGPSSVRGIQSDAGVGQFKWDRVSDSWWWSEGMYALYGYEPDQIEPTLEVFVRHKDPRDMARIEAVFDRCLSVGGPFSCYHRIIDGRGKAKTVVVVGYGDRDAEDTRTVMMHGFMVDVTATSQRETSEALQAALKNRAVIEQVKGAIMLVHGLDADAAFALLRGHSQVYNKKVATIAADLAAAFRERGAAEGITKGELDQMLWDAVQRG